jgi:hypothetical protein
LPSWMASGLWFGAGGRCAARPCPGTVSMPTCLQRMVSRVVRLSVPSARAALYYALLASSGFRIVACRVDIVCQWIGRSVRLTQDSRSA